MQTNSSNKTALITGASAGLGAEFARQLAVQGNNLVLTARRTDRLEALAAELTATFGIKTYVYTADLADPRSPQQLFNKLAADGVDIDILINNAGYGVTGTLTVPDWKTHADFLNVMVNSLVELCYLLLPAMQQRGFGKIINVASMAALVPAAAGHTLYAASKAFVVRFSESLAMENLNTGVKVQALCPGFTYTEFHDVTGTREQMSDMSEKMWLKAEDVISYSLAQIDQKDSLPVSIPGRQYRTIERLMRWLPKKIAYKNMRKRAKDFRQLD
ncbi:MAG: SDR family oxidoreductase [Xanthomonadales bacterium]|nr:SDR family oxidoreductase [Xanthomonadales bacterium]